MRRCGQTVEHLPAYVQQKACAKNAIGPVTLVVPMTTAAGVAELADALDLGSSDANRGGSNPPARTTAAAARENLVITGDLRCK
jgi:hypothetical protein